MCRSYFMPVMLKNAGIISQSQQLFMNAINTILSFASGILGSTFVDQLRRRQLFLYVTFFTGLVYIPIDVIASFHISKTTHSIGYDLMACVFLYGVFFSFCWTPLLAIYTAEILPNRVRAKGMAFQGLISGLANFISFYATPTALANIGWRMYTILCKFSSYSDLWGLRSCSQLYHPNI